MTARPTITLAFDASWKRTGWAICDDRRPLVYGDARLTGDWRIAKVAALVQELRTEAQAVAMQRDADVILVVERCGSHYSWQPHKRGEGDKRGADPTLVVRGISECVGSVGVLGVWPGWRYPWPIEPNDWRAWWSLRGGGRAKIKRYATMLVEANWPDVAKILPPIEEDEDGGDVAEAILLGVGAARRIGEAPKGPSRAIGPQARTIGRFA